MRGDNVDTASSLSSRAVESLRSASVTSLARSVSDQDVKVWRSLILPQPLLCVFAHLVDVENAHARTPRSSILPDVSIVVEEACWLLSGEPLPSSLESCSTRSKEELNRLIFAGVKEEVSNVADVLCCV